MRRKQAARLTTIQRESLLALYQFAREHGRSMTYREWQARTGKAIGTLGGNARNWREVGLLEDSSGIEASLLPSPLACQLLGIPEDEALDYDQIRGRALPQRYHVPPEVADSLDALIGLVTDLRARSRPIEPNLEAVCRWWVRCRQSGD